MTPIPPQRQTFRYIIEGLVQGVSFRYYTRLEAQKLKIDGIVRNLDDGTVEVIAQGSGEQLRKMESFLEKGPAYARVSHLHKEEMLGSREYLDFQIIF